MNARKLLLPLTPLYAVGMALRNYCYSKKIFSSEKFPVPVISVGNITAGGSGKTPCVEMLANILLSKGFIPGIVSRGYKRKSAGLIVVSDGKNISVTAEASGDEPMQVAKKFPRAIVVVAEDKAEAARRAIALGAECIILDDGFQRRDVARDCDIVLCGDELAANNNLLLPAGNGREPLASLRRATIVLALESKRDSAQKNISRYTSAPFLFFSIAPEKLTAPFTNQSPELSSLKGKSLLALTGIANPNRFIATLRSLRGNITGHQAFPDHYWFTEIELKQAVALAQQLNAAIITTEKDWMRIESAQTTREIFQRTELLVMTIALKISDEERFTSLILGPLRPASRRRED